MKRHLMPGVLGLVWVVWAAVCGLNAAEPISKPEEGRVIQYRGPMPLLPRAHWGGEVELRFELYRSPDGGKPFWKEARKVTVATNGWVRVDLGEVVRLPDEAFTTPFRFLSFILIMGQRASASAGASHWWTPPAAR